MELRTQTRTARTGLATPGEGHPVGAEHRVIGDRMRANDSANGKVPDEIVIGGALDAFPRHGFTATCVIGSRAL